ADLGAARHAGAGPPVPAGPLMSSVPTARPRVQVVALLGPTGGGKSAAALRLAGQLSLEIVSVDSAQVYRGMDVGTAKPSCADRARVAHHLIDLLDPAESYCAARFVQDARASIAAIRARGRLPLLVGGTMLYAKALREGLAELPPADPEVRDRLARQAAASGWPALDPQCRLPPGLGSPGRGHLVRRVPRRRHSRQPATGQAADHLAALDARCPRDRPAARRRPGRTSHRHHARDSTRYVTIQPAS